MQTLAGRFDLETGRCLAPTWRRRAAGRAACTIVLRPPAARPCPRRRSEAPIAPPPRRDGVARCRSRNSTRPAPPGLVSAAAAGRTNGLAHRQSASCGRCWRCGTSARRTAGGRRSAACAVEDDFEDMETILKRVRRVRDAAPLGGSARLSARGGVFPQPHPRRRRRGTDADGRRSDRLSVARRGRAAGGCCSSRWRRPRSENGSGRNGCRKWCWRRRPSISNRGKWSAAVALHFLGDGSVVERSPGRLAHRRILAAAAADLGKLSEPRP